MCDRRCRTTKKEEENRVEKERKSDEEMKEIEKRERKNVEEDISNRSMPLPISQQSTHTHIYTQSRSETILTELSHTKGTLGNTHITHSFRTLRYAEEKRARVD